MVDAAPFRALRYDQGVAGDPLSTSAPARDDLDRFDYARHRTASPYTVLELVTPSTVRSERGARVSSYAAAGATLVRWRRTGVLIEDPEPALYAYELREGAHPPQRGLLAAVRAGDPGVLTHEDVDPARVAARVARLRAVPADLAPVHTVAFGLPPALRALLADLVARPPLVALTDEGGVSHRLTATADPDEVAGARALLAGVRAVVADGHHRWAAAGALGDPGARTLLFLVDADAGSPHVLPVHRLAHVLPPDWAARLAPDFDVVPLPPGAGSGPELAAALELEAPGVVGLRTRGRSRLLRPRDLEGLRGRLPAAASAAWRALDVALADRVLLPRLGVPPGTAAARADLAEAADEVDAGAAAGLLVLRPVPLAAIRTLAERGEHLPPKSTSFRPKLRTGLVLRAW